MKTQKNVRCFLWATFVVYGFVLLYILFWSRIGRFPYDSFFEYVKYSVNLIPFNTVWGYVEDYIAKRELWIIGLAIRNIGGNFILFFPMGIFLPCLFPKTRKFRVTAQVSFCTILSVELTQLLLRRGIFDVDDLILNVSGWLIGFAMLRIPFFHKILKKFFILPCEEN